VVAASAVLLATIFACTKPWGPAEQVGHRRTEVASAAGELIGSQACYDCHDRSTVLSDSTFEGHSSHVLEANVACWSCHDSHGSRDAPGLVRFGKDLRLGDVAPSTSGRWEYVPEQSACYITCHGVDHDPLGYP